MAVIALLRNTSVSPKHTEQSDGKGHCLLHAKTHKKEHMVCTQHTLHDELGFVLLEVRPLLSHHDSQQLILQTGGCDAEVEQAHACAHL